VVPGDSSGRDPDQPPSGGPDSPQASELSKLFEQHNRHLVSFLAHRLGNEAEARDVAQEAYVRVLQLNEPGAISFLRAYLYRTAANLATDRLRHRTRAGRLDPTYDGDALTNALSPDRQVLAREELTLVRQALLELPARYRRAFVLHRFEDRSTEEIARDLRLRPTQVRLYLRRALAYCGLRLEGLSRTEAERQVFR
jgi:RNA polymerase sigma-70 factor (ECF subfamily)